MVEGVGQDWEKYRNELKGALTLKSRLNKAAEDGVIFAVKYGVVLMLWWGSGLLVWEKFAELRQQAINGGAAYNFLYQNAGKLNAILSREPDRGPVK